MPESIIINRAHQLYWGTLVLLLPAAILVFATDLLRAYWLPILMGWGGVLLVFAFRAPACIRFDAEKQELEISYLLKGLVRRSKCYPFARIAAVQSVALQQGDDDAKIVLQVVLTDGSLEVINRTNPEWAKTGSWIGLKGCREPNSTTQLRNRIAALTGAQNRGYLGAQ
jgi:hypothetical protein